ncbi:MdtA/MuxA family multidrug efflux RND transporter periplasmic adaptor subunit [Methylocapsa acidiphila]|uniref:MdtA/MuxA family multidrug efflux RND transporter periplasmic adaptor subunit n=1 Tax=Methylocapsa acidiphila TaxID=133552 RepID=UPI001FD967D7|nr:MdtA/MuxA family multidrug efflux RND transporter periplasmic adaptor subunit [Methylocapsa acidiphila]
MIAALGWQYLKPTATPAGKPADAPRPVPVSIVAVSGGDLRVTLAGLGTVTPLATVSVKSEISGKLVQIAYQEGQMVKQGDFLAEIDPRPYQNALHQAQGQLMRDQALLENAKLDLERYRRLVKQDSAPRQQLDTQDSLVHQYEGVVKIDQALVDNAELNLDYCRIKAPVSGRVGLRLADLGAYVTSGDANGIVVLAQLQPISVVFPVAEDHLPAVMKQIQAGKKPPVEAYDRSGGALLAKGFLATVDNQVDPTTGTVKFKAQFDNSDLALFPNQFVNARLLVDMLRDRIVVPSAAIQYGPAGPFVYVVGVGDAAAMTPVKVGPSEGDRTAVLSGLSAGARVVIAGADRLRDGAKVRVLETKAADGKPAAEAAPGTSGELSGR